MIDSMDGSTSQPSTSSRPIKKRAACDECRTKKLKCTGEQPVCVRCVREGIACNYSLQKQMGRPKKRPRNETDGGDATDCGRSRRQQTDAAADVSTYGTAFQPWLIQQDNSWSFGAAAPSEHAIPGFTPDNDNPNPSPPLIHLPPELQQCTPRDASTNLLLDPTLSSSSNLGLSNDLLPSCACLSTMYLALNTVRSMRTPFTFPFSLYPLREAMSTAHAILLCEECPKKFVSGIQNTQLIGTLLVCIAERFGKVLGSITAEATRAGREHEMKKFRLTDLNTSTCHLHTGGLSCLAAFSVDLSPDEWRSMSKKVVRAEVYGASTPGQDASDHMSCPNFIGIIRQMRKRQQRWHEALVPEDFPTDREGRQMGGPRGDFGAEKKDYLCLKLPAYAEKIVGESDWS